MNRSVLEGITVFDRKHYANDALQWILGNMIPDYRSGFLHKPIRKEANSDIEYTMRMDVFNKQMKAMSLLIDIFDTIVANGKEKALQFIEDNKYWLTSFKRE